MGSRLRIESSTTVNIALPALAAMLSVLLNEIARAFVALLLCRIARGPCIATVG